ncbi:MAG TPA: helix-turn-helix transcriptional regulator [Candidatus Limnocylindrales bacterium]|nr:helix-turn-helix transcriptional regulator [Candidatus Limnocylindrales bacterium]
MKRILLAARRKIVGLSQEALAEQLGIDVSTVRRWEYGERQPQPWQRPNLATALKVTLEQLDVLLAANDAHGEPSDDAQHYGYTSNSLAANHIGNPALDALIRGAGYASLQQFAKAVNDRAHNRRKLCTGFDHLTVQRWLAGSAISNPDVVAEVLSEAWGVPIPVEVIWPELRNGKPLAAAQLQPWVAGRTLEALGIFIRTDMLTRRETLTQAVKAISGPALIAPIANWLSVSPGRLEPRDHGTQRIGATEVEAIERSTRYFAATDAEIGGVLSREAAVGQLKYAVDLARHAMYSEAVGNRLLAAIAELSGLVGWLNHDSGLAGPAQQYLIYGLQAARESADPRAESFVVSILADMGAQMRWLGRPEAALRLYDLALRQLPPNRRRYTVLRARLAAKRAEDGLAYLGLSRLSEVRDALSLSFDLYAQASDEDKSTAAALWHRALDLSQAGLSVAAACAYVAMAQDDPRLASEAEKHAIAQLAVVPEGQGRNRLVGQIQLARLRLRAGEAEQACEDGDQALRMAGSVSSAMVRTRLRDLLADSEPYAAVPRVVEFRDRLRGVIAGLN